MDKEAIIEKLVSLAQADYDVMCVYDEALRRIEKNDKDIRDNLMLYRNDHALHVNALSTAITDLGGNIAGLSPESRGRLAEGVIPVTALMGTVDALQALRQNEIFLNRIYGNAITDAAFTSFPIDIQEHIKNNRYDDEHHLTYLEAALNELAITAR